VHVIVIARNTKEKSSKHNDENHVLTKLHLSETVRSIFDKNFFEIMDVAPQRLKGFS
jgi:hypothetical protein